ncbi:MAG: hypothetical protein RLY70_3742, partial [Planctomycetota bacterium]
RSPCRLCPGECRAPDVRGTGPAKLATAAAPERIPIPRQRGTPRQRGIPRQLGIPRLPPSRRRRPGQHSNERLRSRSTIASQPASRVPCHAYPVTHTPSRIPCHAYPVTRILSRGAASTSSSSMARPSARRNLGQHRAAPKPHPRNGCLLSEGNDLTEAQRHGEERQRE